MAFTTNADGTMTDTVIGLIWVQTLGIYEDRAINSDDKMIFDAALAYADTQTFAGHNDWPLPNIKQLQILVNFTRLPNTSDSTAIDSMFNAPSIVNRAGAMDYRICWFAITHANRSQTQSKHTPFVNFGRAMEFMRDNWVDGHGAGAQRPQGRRGGCFTLRAWSARRCDPYHQLCPTGARRGLGQFCDGTTPIAPRRSV
jgi:hypothetical protein